MSPIRNLLVNKKKDVAVVRAWWVLGIKLEWTLDPKGQWYSLPLDWEIIDDVFKTVPDVSVRAKV